MAKTKTQDPTPLAILEALRDTDVNDPGSAEALRQSYCAYCAAAYGNPGDERLAGCRNRRYGLLDQTLLLEAQVLTLSRYLELSGPPEPTTPFMLRILNAELWQSGALVPGLTFDIASSNLALSFTTPTLRASLYAALLTAVAIHHGEIMISTISTTGEEAQALVIDTRRNIADMKRTRAQDSIKQRGLSLRQAARRNGIKPSTLYDHSLRVRKPGKPDTHTPGRSKKRDVDS